MARARALAPTRSRVLCPDTPSWFWVIVRRSSVGTTTTPSPTRSVASSARSFAAKHELAPELVVVTGLLLGAETLAARAALDAGVPFVAVLPYPEPQRAWPRVSQERFAALIEVALDVITLQRKAPESKAKAGAALARRDAWLARHAEEAVLVWDQREASLGKLYRSLVDHLGEEHVWLLEPPAAVAG